MFLIKNTPKEICFWVSWDFFLFGLVWCLFWAFLLVFVWVLFVRLLYLLLGLGLGFFGFFYIGLLKQIGRLVTFREKSE